MTLNGSLCSVFACRQPFPAGDRVTFNGKECVCQKCTQPLPANSPAPIQAVHSQCLRPCTASITHTAKPNIFSLDLAQSQNFSRHFHPLMSPCVHSAPPLSIPRLLVSSSAQTAAAAGKSSRTSSHWWRWTSTGTWAASSAKSATRCSTPSTSASKSGNVA